MDAESGMQPVSMPFELHALAGAAQREGTPGGIARFDALDIESLVLNLELSLNVRARHQFFSWTQGPLQSLIEHDLLICALRPRRPAPTYIDSFSTRPIDAARVNDMLRDEGSFLATMTREWKRNRCEPLVCDLANDTICTNIPAARLLREIGIAQLIAHGTQDAGGEWASLFAFAPLPDRFDSKWLYLISLAVPFLHTAWVRSLANRPAVRTGTKAAPPGHLTARQQEIVRWIYRGKNNTEIGLILNVSPLTVKNHVQRILRKLNVMNRAQAVGKALALGIVEL